MGEKNLKKMLGDRIKSFRLALGITRRELSERVGVSETHIYNMEAGRGGYSLDSLEKFATALNCKIMDFYNFENEIVSDKIEKYNEKVMELDLTTKTLLDALFEQWTNEKVILIINYLIKNLINRSSKHEK